MKKETVIHIPERGCHNCRLHCVNHRQCNSEYPCKQGTWWQPILNPKQSNSAVELSDEQIEEEEYHEIHDDIIEAKRNGEIE